MGGESWGSFSLALTSLSILYVLLWSSKPLHGRHKTHAGEVEDGNALVRISHADHLLVLIPLQRGDGPETPALNSPCIEGQS